MRIYDIDPNLAVASKISQADVVWFDAKEKPFRVYGLSQAEPGKLFLRMPEKIAKQVSLGVQYGNTNTAGGRIRFRTNSPYIAIKAVMPDNATMPHITMLGQSGFDLYCSDAGAYRYVSSFMPGERAHGYESLKNTDERWHTYTIHMPLYDSVEEVYIGLSEGAELDFPEDYTRKKPIVYYGSSITQGGCASRPGNAYPAMISRRLDCDHINLGFSGSGKAEQAMCDYLASLECALLVCDYDYNASDADYLEKTHYNLYKTFRERQGETPILFVSKPDFRVGTEDERRRDIIMHTVSRAEREGDTHVCFVDGAHLFDGDFADSCTVDGCHPNDLGFFRMAKEIGDRIVQMLQLSL